MVIRESSDAGRPVMALEPDGPHAEAYHTIGERVWQQLKAREEAGDSQPAIVFE
jgi:ATP-binding protein involved in chromosome partitioning